MTLDWTRTRIQTGVDLGPQVGDLRLKHSNPETPLEYRAVTIAVLANDHGPHQC